MTLERFVRQLDGCSYYVIAADGSHVSSAGSNCSCGSDGMWLYRATRGRASTTSCHVRTLTGDHLGGTDLEQMEAVNHNTYSVFTGRRYQPGDAAMLLNLVKSGRFGAIWQLSYAPVNPTIHDASRRRFFGNHAVYLSGPGRTAGTIRVGDPLADGRYAGCPNGFADWPESLLVNGAGKLVMKPGVTLNSEVGPGKVYAYLTPADPPPGDRYRVVISGYTPLYAAPFGSKVGAVTQATYIATRTKISGFWWYRIVSKGDGSRTANGGRYFKPNRYTRAYTP